MVKDVIATDDEGDSVVIRQEVSKEKRKFIFRWMEIYIIIMVFIVCALVRRSLERDENGQEEQEEQGKNIFTQVEEIEDKYGINIMWEGRCDEQRANEFSKKPSMTGDEEKIKYALGEIESILERFPEGSFDEYKEETVPDFKREYVDVYLCENIVSDTMTDGVRAACTDAYHKCNGMYVLIDVNQKEIFKRGVAHELFHVIENKIGFVSVYNSYKDNEIMKGIYVDWQKCNPNGYKYLSFGNNQDVIHVFEGDLPYDINTEKIENVYFVNKYAQLSDQEDRAETFSFLIACDDADDLPESYNSPHVKEKAKLIVDMIDDTFECVDDNAYWARMYHEKYGDV